MLTSRYYFSNEKLENFELPYGYIYPQVNFTEGVPDDDKHCGEANLIDSFKTKDFSIDTVKVDDQLDHLIHMFQEKETRFLRTLAKNGLIKDEKAYDDHGFFQLTVAITGTVSKEVERIKKLLTGAIDQPIYRGAWYKEPFERQMQNLMGEYFIGLLVPNNALWGINLTEKRKITSGEAVLQLFKPEVLNDIKKKAEVNIEVRKAVANLIAWYDHPKHATIKQKEQETYNMLKDYAKKFKLRKASDSIDYEHTNMYEFIAKMVDSAVGKVYSETGTVSEKDLLEGILKQIEAMGGNLKAKLTGNMRGSVTLSAESDKFLYNSEMFEEETWQKKMQQALRSRATAVTNPKADITLTDPDTNEQWGLSVKHQSLQTTNSESKSHIELHKGTYISLIRYLMRYKEGIPLAQELMEPEVMHTVLNLTRGDIGKEVTSDALDKAISALGYVFIGMGDEADFLTDYGVDIFSGTAGSNTIMALVDGNGNGRLMSYYLQDIKNNIDKAQLAATFKIPKNPSHMIFAKNSTYPNTYSKYVYFETNQATTADFSTIVAQIYIDTFKS